jgi:hypothetical protein
MKDGDLLKGQIKVIDNLQEKIKLLQFDISRNLETIQILKGKLERKDKAIAKVKEELEEIKKTNNYSNINMLIKYIRVAEDEE